MAGPRQTARTRAASAARSLQKSACAARLVADSRRRARTRAARVASQQSVSVQSTQSAGNAEPRVRAVTTAGKPPVFVVQFVKLKTASSVVKDVLRRKKEKAGANVVILVKI